MQGLFLVSKTGGIILRKAFLLVWLDFFNHRYKGAHVACPTESFLATMQVDVFFAKLISGCVALIKAVLILI